MDFKLEVDTTHFVVLFSEGNKILSTATKKEVELIPRSWLVSVAGVWQSYYPPEEDYQFVEDWVEESKEPNTEKWETFEVQILKQAHSHSQGLRRLRQSFLTYFIETSSQNESETNKNKNKDKNVNAKEVPIKLTPTAAKTALRNLPVFHGSVPNVTNTKASETSDDSGTSPLKEKQKKRPRKESLIRSAERPTKKQTQGSSESELDRNDRDSDGSSSSVKSVGSLSKDSPTKCSSSSSKDLSVKDVTPEKKLIEKRRLPRNSSSDSEKGKSPGKPSSPKKPSVKLVTPREKAIKVTSLMDLKKKHSGSQKEKSAGKKGKGKLSLSWKANATILKLFKCLQRNIEKKIENSKRSILYDFNNKINELRDLIKTCNDPDLLEALQQRDI